MLILAFESSCDETAAAVVSVEKTNGREHFEIKSNIVASQIDIHRLYGGVVPEIASRAHIEAISGITYNALSEANVTLGDIDLVAVTSHPGLIGALLVGVNFAKSLAYANNIPLTEVDHIKGHIGAAYLGVTDPPEAPYVALAVSGGHTSLYLVDEKYRFTQIGTTGDDAIGESFDKVGRIIGIPYPAGAGFDRLAQEGFCEVTKAPPETAYEKYSGIYRRIKSEMNLPSPAISGDNLNFSFSGLKTAAINLLHRYETHGEDIPRARFAAAYTFEAVEAVARKLESAINRYGAKSAVIAGGVAANSHLRRRVGEICKKNGAKLHVPPVSLCGDNAAMIAVAGYFNSADGRYADISLNASALDEE